MTLDELDRLAAEKVMGWKDGDMAINGDWHIDLNGNKWEPTRDIAQAWECLDKIENVAQYSISLSKQKNLPTYAKCSIYMDAELKQFGIYVAGIISFKDEGETIPIAIVRACLKAKGVEI